MPVLPGAEPFAADGGPVGVLVLHGLTGSPQSVRPWAEGLAGAGFTVRAPRLPGHGTRWEELALTRWQDWLWAAERCFDELRERCATVAVAGLSMGGTLAVRLAELRGDEVAAVALVNPSLLDPRPVIQLLPVLRRLRPHVRGIASDIARPGVTELAYDRLPLAALASLRELWALTRADLHEVDQPLLVHRSAQDHVVAAASTRELLRGVSSTDVTEVVLTRSYHVATLDHDAGTIVEGTAAFLRRTARVAA